MKAKREHKSLRLIYEYFKSHGVYPSNAQVAKWLRTDINSWGNTRRRLLRHGKLVESLGNEFELHSDVLESFRQQDEQFQKLKSTEEPVMLSPLIRPPERPGQRPINPAKEETRILLVPGQEGSGIPDDAMEERDEMLAARGLAPTDIPVYGTVHAGTDLGPDDIRIELSSALDPLSLRGMNSGQEIYALQVTGKSMVSDNIQPNDYVIVEKVDAVKVGDLVVAMYLKKEFIRASEAEIDNLRKNRDNYMGPTIKYFVKMDDAKGCYVLAPRNRDKKYTIETRDLKPDELGKVLSVYREVRRLRPSHP